MGLELGRPEGLDPERFGDPGLSFSRRLGGNLGRDVVSAEGRVRPRF
jgi:hypothetical protein